MKMSNTTEYYWLNIIDLEFCAQNIVLLQIGFVTTAMIILLINIICELLKLFNHFITYSVVILFIYD